MGEGPETVGRYEVYAKIASGGMASVHFARLRGDAGFSRTVAIKRLHRHLTEDHPEFLMSMVDEARLAARIHHPNVVPTLDVVTVKGELLVVMEYVRGESLARLLSCARERGQQTPLPMASAVLVGALHGLHAAHEAKSDSGEPLGIVHRDVSPQNILVGVDGHARVIDFGVAKAAGRLQTTSDGAVKGKLAYMAPEQLEGRQVSRRSDVYAMAVIMWEIFTGKRLFQGNNELELVGSMLAGVRDPPGRHVSGLPEGLDALVMRGLDPDPEKRFNSAREMADALTRIVPPAFPPEVASWVEAMAVDSLAHRAAVLARIEGHSETAVEQPPGPRSTDPDVQVATMRLSSLSVDQTPEVQPGGGRSRRPWFAGALLAATAFGALAGFHAVSGRGADPLQAPSTGQAAGPPRGEATLVSTAANGPALDAGSALATSSIQAAAPPASAVAQSEARPATKSHSAAASHAHSATPPKRPVDPLAP